MTRFVLDLGDLKVSKELQSAIAGDLQKVLLGHLAKVSLNEAIAVKFPKEWYGMLARRQVDEIPDQENRIQEVIKMIANR